MRSRAFFLLLFAAGCTGKPDTADPKREFGTEKVLIDADYDTCERNVYWPATLFPIVAYGLPPVAPPYEITHIGGSLFHDPQFASCNATAGLEVQVWVSSETPERLPDGASGRPDLPEPLATVRLALDTVPADGDRWPEVEVAVDPPVLVEEAGTLWVSAVNFVTVDMTTYATTTPPVACLAGCDGVGDTAYQWIDGYSGYNGWVPEASSLPLVYVKVRHD